MTEFVAVHPTDPQPRVIRRVAARLADGAVLAYPTDSSNALGCRLHAAQATFALTGSLHATGLFSPDGKLLCLREDVGRHNAMDKVVGWAFREGRLPLERALLCVSGRLSFELGWLALAVYSVDAWWQMRQLAPLPPAERAVARAEEPA